MSDPNTTYRKLTLEADLEGIWLLSMEPDGPYQMGHIPWSTIAKYLEITRTHP